ncbi:hypothetical protein C436_01475 [Haloarcula marismortui ATCC 33800]|uniref:Uncharacterized protein n=1 Tax=Haloarcula marismortui ATCC 33800 TaxID=662476 RepID=M0K4S1_9EURY|nr:hypothetical protein C436_01475 [Haloarcula sinaiiensis ATCC 33800]
MTIRCGQYFIDEIRRIPEWVPINVSPRIRGPPIWRIIITFQFRMIPVTPFEKQMTDDRPSHSGIIFGKELKQGIHFFPFVCSI